MKLLALLSALLLLLPALAVAQEPVATPTAGIEDEAPGVTDEDADDPVDDEDPVEGDDAYTCDDAGTDADYVYCDAAGAGEPRPTAKKAPAVARAQALPAGTLPYTGSSPGLVALLGLSLVLVGVGARLMIASNSSAVRSRSSVTWR